MTHPTRALAPHKRPTHPILDKRWDELTEADLGMIQQLFKKAEDDRPLVMR